MLRSTMYVTTSSGCLPPADRVGLRPSSSSGAVVVEVEEVAELGAVAIDGIMSGGRQEGERAVGHAAGGGEPAEELGEAGEMRVRQPVVEVAEVRVARRHAERRCASRASPASASRCARPQSRDSSSRACTASASARSASRRATHTANTNGRPVHCFHSAPRSCERPGRGPAGAQVQRRVADDEPRVVRLRSSAARSAGFGAHGAKSGGTCQTCSNSSSSSATCVIERGHEHRGPLEFVERSREEHHAAHRPVARDREVGQQEIRAASRAYSTAETTLTSSSPAASRSLSGGGGRHQRRASPGTMPRSIAP